MTGLRLGEAQALEWADLDFKMKQSELKNQCFIKMHKNFTVQSQNESKYSNDCVR